MDRMLMFAIDDDVPIIFNAINNVAEGLMQPLMDANPDEVRERIPLARNENFYEVTIPQFTDDLFKDHFRMSRRAFEALTNIIGHNMRNQDRIDVSKKLLFTIWTLAKPESFLAVGDRFGLAKSTAHGIFKDVIRVLSNLMPRYVKFPTPEEYDLIAHNFERRSRGIRGVIGAIDGCHIPCKQPEHNPHDFYNRKGFHSVILQGTCDHRGAFIDCFIGMPGRMHDARVFRNSPLYGLLTNGENPLPVNYHLIGDSAYPLLMSLMCPFRDNGHLTATQTTFNTKLSSVRSIIERAFGMLKNKFRRLKYLDVAGVEFANHIIAAACVLHNFLIRENEINMQEEFQPDLNEVGNDVIQEEEEGPLGEAADKRMTIARHL